jgi:phage terminase large subunit-like protein
MPIPGNHTVLGYFKPRYPLELGIRHGQRMAAQSIKIKQGRVFLPRKAEWLDAFHKEILAFPYGAHDDQVDALSQFLQWQDDRNRVRVTRLIGL